MSKVKAFIRKYDDMTLAPVMKFHLDGDDRNLSVWGGLVSFAITCYISYAFFETAMKMIYFE